MDKEWALTCADCVAAQLGGADKIPHCPILDSLLDQGIQTFLINPKQLDRLWDRFRLRGPKMIVGIRTYLLMLSELIQPVCTDWPPYPEFSGEFQLDYHLLNRCTDLAHFFEKI